jgi:transcriptional regulator with XRE-family HTH domain
LLRRSWVKLARTKEWRESHGLTQRELAAQAGVGEVTVARIETGASVSPPTARKIAATLGVAVADLLERPPVPLAETRQEPGQRKLSGPDPEVWEDEESPPKVPMPETAGKHIHVQIGAGEVTVTEKSFLDIFREIREGRIASEEEVLQRLQREDRKRSA